MEVAWAMEGRESHFADHRNLPLMCLGLAVPSIRNRDIRAINALQYSKIKLHRTSRTMGLEDWWLREASRRIIPAY